MNTDAANKSFKKKKQKIYEKEKRIKITKDLTNFPNFTKKTIIKRQKDLADHAIEIWGSKNII